MNAEIIVNGLDVQKEEQLHNKKTENASKIRITKEKMNTLFYKLASSEKIRTLKEKAINPDSLKNNNDILNYDSPTKAYKRLDHDLGLENYIPTDCISLLSDNNILNLNIGEIEKEINLKDNGLSDKESNNKCPNDILLSQDNFCYQSTRNQTRETNPLSASMNPFNKQSITSKNDLNKSFQFKTPTNKAKPSKLIRDTTKKSFTKNNNKNDQLNRSMILSKPKNSSLIKKRLGKPSINGNITSCFKNKIQSNDNTQNDKSSMIIIEEYDYSKLLKDLHSIFGEELEYFDEECNNLLIIL